MQEKIDGPIVYRLGHQVLILERGVRLPLGLREKVISLGGKCHISFPYFSWDIFFDWVDVSEYTTILLTPAYLMASVVGFCRLLSAYEMGASFTEEI